MKQYFSFQWNITDECDQQCKHCYIFSGDSCKKIDSMNWHQMQDAFYNCIDFCKVYNRLPYFYITGGDPILYPDFWRLLELLHEHSVPFTILENPFHLNNQICRELKTYGCEKYQMSIDGLRETHDWFRKPGSYDCTFEKIGCINRAGIRSVVMTPQEYRDLLAVCDKKFKEYKTGASKIPEAAEDGMIYGGCNCGNCHITILPTGEVYACRRVADSHVGNIFTGRLADIWVTNMECYREYNKFGKCAKCKLLAFCRGCPAVAKGTNGDFYAADPQCWADENSGLFRK